MKEPINQQNKHLENLIEKTLVGISDIKNKETDLSNILLKGHLFIEALLEELLAAYSLNKQFSIGRASFYKKVDKLSDLCAKNQTLTPTEKEQLNNLIPLLHALNSVRNNLAHDLNFKVSEADINKIGINIGSEFILQKYETGHSDLKNNLIFCLNKIVEIIGSSIYIKVELLKTKKIT